MDAALLDILTDEYQEPSFDSIRTHLARLLNTRQGSLSHMPDYGIPDVTELYQGLPYTTNTIIENIRKVITKYEPRLQNLVIAKSALQADDCILQLEIMATTIEQQELKFATYLQGNGQAQIAIN